MLKTISNQIHAVCCLALIGSTASLFADECNPQLNVAGDQTVDQVLRALAKEHDFALSIPASVNGAVSVASGQRLNHLLSSLTKKYSTYIEYEVSDDCLAGYVTSVTILPKSSGDTVNRFLPSNEAREYLYIPDMHQYVEDVLNKKAKAQVRRMTEAQKQEYRKIRKELRKEQKKLSKQERQVLKEERKKNRLRQVPITETK